MITSREKKCLALFDLDGTLFDTGDVNFSAYEAALKAYGFHLDRDYFLNRCNGKHYTEFLPDIMGGTEYMEEVHRKKKELYRQNLDLARPNLHLFWLIREMAACYHTAVVTTASRKNTMEILQHFQYMDYFEKIISQEDITKSKPDPQGYLLAMEQFHVLPENTVIFEDSEAGIAAARATGAAVMIVDRF